MSQIPPIYHHTFPMYYPPPFILPYNFDLYDKVSNLIKKIENQEDIINQMSKNINSLIEINKSLVVKINTYDDKIIKIENDIDKKSKNKLEEKLKNKLEDKLEDKFEDKSEDKSEDKYHRKKKTIVPQNTNKQKQPFNNIFNDIIKEGDKSIVIQMETDNFDFFGKPMNNSNSLFNPFKILSSLFDENKNKEKKETEEELELDIISECNSDEEVEELDIEIKTIDDLIKIGLKYNVLNNTTEQITDEHKNNIRKELKKFGIADEISEKMLIENDIFMEKKYQTDKTKIIENKTDNINIKNKTGSISKGLYEINGKKYPINLETLNKLVKPLTKLKNIIGMDKVKSGIFDMILYYLQNFETKNNSMLHTIIEGPPGVGKTMIGRIIGELYATLGIIPSNKFKLVKRTDLIGEYVGHTAHKTQKVIDEANGGILFIDEAYSLGSDGKKDTFSKECIDVINQNLSENKTKFICIIAGYPTELEKCFFSYNPGLKRRFPFKYSIESYTSDEMYNIFMKMINDIKWKITNNINENEIYNVCKENKNLINKINCISIEEDIKILEKVFNINIVNNEKMLKYINENKDKFNFENDTIKDISSKLNNIINDINFGFPIELYYKKIITKIFDKNKNEFKNYGGDLENLLVICKFSHSKRTIGKHPKLKRKLNLEDIRNGFNNFVENKKKENDSYQHMYI